MLQDADTEGLYQQRALIAKLALTWKVRGTAAGTGSANRMLHPRRRLQGRRRGQCRLRVRLLLQQHAVAARAAHGNAACQRSCDLQADHILVWTILDGVLHATESTLSRVQADVLAVLPVAGPKALAMFGTHRLSIKIHLGFSSVFIHLLKSH